MALEERVYLVVVDAGERAAGERRLVVYSTDASDQRVLARTPLGGSVAAADGPRASGIGVFVNSDPGFTDQAKVANGASELFETLFGEAGRHARAAVGVAVLPLGAAVEADAIVAVRPA